MEKVNSDKGQSTACILCSINCGIKIDVENNQFTSIRGDKEHLNSEGYLCQKAARLNYYQNHTGRLEHPLRRKSNQDYEKINWKIAVNEVADKLTHIRNTYGSHAIAYYGGGGQGNHMCQIYSSSFRAALGTPYLYTALAQEKTGDFWVNGKLFGKQSCHISEDVENSDYLIVIGANPWQSHGFPRARKVLGEIAKDPKRKMVVIDPRMTKTAEMADVHLQIKPGTDAYLLSAILGIIIQEGLEDHDFLGKHTVGFDHIKKIFTDVTIEDYVRRSGLDLKLVQNVARAFANADRGCVRVDLGIQQSLHSTLNSYLEKLLFIITGNFGKKGCNNLHTQLVPIVGHSNEPKKGGVTTKVTGMKEISNFFPPNILPSEIDTDHPERVRALIVDSSNPILTAADSNAYRKAFEKLDLLVVIDVANTETARMAHYVLPAQSQFEKWEAAFFTLDFPSNYFQLRKPIVEPKGDTLAEPEIYRRIMVAMGLFPKRLRLLERMASWHFRFPSLGVFPVGLKMFLTLYPTYKKSVLMILYATLGKVLPDKANNAAMLWGASHLYAKRYRKAVLRTGLKGKGFMLGENLFKQALEKRSGIKISEHLYEEVWDLLRYPDKKIHLVIPEMIDALHDLEKEQNTDKEFPFVLAAGERRSYNANQIFRDPEWRKKDKDGALRIHPEDAAKVDVLNGDLVLCTSAKDTIKVQAIFDEAMQLGYVSLPHGYGFEYIDPDNLENLKQNGPQINRLTSSEHCDPIAKTPYHKYVPVQIKPITVLTEV